MTEEDEDAAVLLPPTEGAVDAAGAADQVQAGWDSLMEAHQAQGLAEDSREAVDVIFGTGDGNNRAPAPGIPEANTEEAQTDLS